MPRGKQADYLVPDLLAPDLRLVFCGTAPSKASAAAKAYYAKPGNKFWPTLHQVGITPRRFTPHEYPQLLALGIGLTDLCKLHSGVDADLPDDAFDLVVFRRKLEKYRPAMVAFTSKHAAQSALGRRVDYGLQAEMMGGTRLFVLPSPSGLATRFFNIEMWRELARASAGG
ncbi:MAG: mismatch-specific DNA-glycosylase [Betaproteobacteria bacterium]